MWDASARLLRLLALLQRRYEWNAEQLSTELEVTPRTVRRDVGRLRELGYPVTAVLGAGGGYHLRAGTALPPLMFETQEALAVLLALRDLMGNTSAVTSRSDGALTAFEKLHRVMPDHLQPIVQAFLAHTSNLDLGNAVGSKPHEVSIPTLVLLTRACRDRRQIQCHYRSSSGQSGNRLIEPLHLIRTMGNWYLIAYSLEAASWRTFRIDRLSELEITNKPSYPRNPPALDLHDYVTAQLARGWQQVQGSVRVHAPRSVVIPWINTVWGVIIEEDSETCIVKAGADSYTSMARWLLLIGARLTVLEPEALRNAFADLAAEVAAVGQTPPS